MRPKLLACAFQFCSVKPEEVREVVHPVVHREQVHRRGAVVVDGARGLGSCPLALPVFQSFVHGNE